MLFHNRFDAPSKDIYCKREVVEVILVETLGKVKGEYLFKVVPPGKPLPGGSKVRGNFRLSSEQDRSPESKLIATPIDKRVGNPRT